MASYHPYTPNHHVPDLSAYNHPEDDDQRMQARTVEAVRKAVREAVLSLNLRFVVIEHAIERLRLSLDKNIRRPSTKS